ncbi:hypothetical protein [Streptomyces graminilatus]|uniref:hypothetical protein n=1 Tax=Streptomyces graminilatus TaxID=1464070 RepID=UPI0006E43361|nr:hypothetical protein [Streptomyces graminilatus]
MTGTKPLQAATEGTWALPLLALAPLTAIRLLAAPSTPWLTISWAIFALAVLLVAIGWTTVFRRGMREFAAWVTCVLVHAVLAWQFISLVQE